jgi:hypothetical protein
MSESMARHYNVERAMSSRFSAVLKWQDPPMQQWQAGQIAADALKYFPNHRNFSDYTQFSQ